MEVSIDVQELVVYQVAQWVVWMRGVDLFRLRSMRSILYYGSPVLLVADRLVPHALPFALVVLAGSSIRTALVSCHGMRH